jgi:predicted O-methyltransferase YrrM
MIEHFWRTVPGHFTWPDFCAFVANRFVAQDRKLCLAEVGVLNGQSAACMAVELLRHGLDASQLYLIDLNIDRVRLLETLAPVREVIGPMLQGRSWEVATRFSGYPIFDYVMLDADHAYESISRDIAAWWPKVRPGGILAGHDYSAEFPGVLQAVTEAFENVRVHRGMRFCGPEGDQPPGNYYPVWWVEKETR